MNLTCYRSGGVEVGLNGETFKYWQYTFGKLIMAGAPFNSQDVIFLIDRHSQNMALKVITPGGEGRTIYENKKY